MTTEKRLSSAELVQELRAALDARTGWLPALYAPDGPAGLPIGTGFESIVERLQEFADSPAVPDSVQPLLERAAEAANSALATDGAVQYGHLGAAYAYLTQAHGVVGSDGTP